jgi:flagellar biosynthetic protein FlhB
MSDQSQRTEKPTNRRIHKAREEGDFVITRQLLAGVQFATFAWLLTAWGAAWTRQMAETMRWVLRVAMEEPLSPARLVSLQRTAVLQTLLPLAWAGAAMVSVVFLAQLAATQFGLSAKKLAPDAGRLNPVQRLSGVFHANLSALTQAVVLLPLFGYILYKLSANSMAQMLSLPRMSLPDGLAWVRGTLFTLTWQAALFFVLFGLAAYGREYFRYMKKLRMSKQELRDEAKETEGNPLIKGRVRRIQRDIRRRRMMQNVPKATAVIVNPTHYAVAIRYELGMMGAPVVVAKGRNYLARRIRQIAVSYGVPIVENPPLARGLYSAAEVNQEIPSHLYRAVAEVLSYIFRLTGQHTH